MASSEGYLLSFFIIILLPAERSTKETVTWQIQIRFLHIFHVSFFTCAMLHVSCYPIIFSLLLYFFWGGGGEARCEVLFFFSVKKEGDEKGDVEEDGGVREFVPLCCAVWRRLQARGWSEKLQQTNLVSIQGRKSISPLVSRAPCTGPTAPKAQEVSFSSVLVNF